MSDTNYTDAELRETESLLAHALADGSPDAPTVVIGRKELDRLKACESVLVSIAAARRAAIERCEAQDTRLRSLSSAAPLDMTDIKCERVTGRPYLAAPCGKCRVCRLLAEVTRLRAVEAELRGEIEKKSRELDREDRAHSNTIEELDRRGALLDRVVNALGGQAKHGEHSNLNCPWTNAIVALEAERKPKPPIQYCDVCYHAMYLHNPDGSCGCGMNCAALSPKTPPRSCDCGHDHVNDDEHRPNCATQTEVPRE